ncbi:MAG: hypothetical protein RR772_08555 [Gordonibacter sp.]
MPEFQDAYAHLNMFFSDIATILSSSQGPKAMDKMYREARKKFVFSEVNGINLGFAESEYGAGFGKTLSDKVLQDAFEIIKSGSKQPEIFHLVGLFEENIGPDRLSDMIATIIQPDIEAYTRRILEDLGINHLTRPGLSFNSEGLINNPFKKTCILLLPVDILHELPIARCWEDIEHVASENAAIRREINEEICEEWSKWASAAKKNYIREHVFMQPDRCQRVIDNYREECVAPFNPSSNVDYFAKRILKELRGSLKCDAERNDINSLQGALDVIAIFQDWVENHRGWDFIREAPSAKREKCVQLAISLAGKHYVQVNNLDFSSEPDAGRGPVDFKLSRANDKTVVEVKLSSNSQYLHGYQEQIQEYGKAENTSHLVYVYVDLGDHPRRLEKIKTAIKADEEKHASHPEAIIIDATPKKAASTFHANNTTGPTSE